MIWDIYFPRQKNKKILLKFEFTKSIDGEDAAQGAREVGRIVGT